MTDTSSPRLIDVRTVVPRQRHALIFSSFDALQPGEALELVNDHDPRPLYYQFEAQLNGQFGWQYLQEGPDLWRVAITRKGAAHGASACCGSCGGGH